MKTLKDILILIVVFALVFIAPHYLHRLLDPKVEASEERGCVASAYQAARYGHDLEANLAACE